MMCPALGGSYLVAGGFPLTGAGGLPEPCNAQCDFRVIS
jgi:hypothetical protein